eukprot:XP_011602199.1 PREDICTED: uncharacterized protein LOC105416440 [Takifugu rubripes]
MQMSGRATSVFVALLVTLASASAVQKLNSISDLKKIQFGKSVPKHCLILLHWFANEVEVDNNHVIRLTFDPNSDYGSHHYGNYEGILVPLRRGYRYFTIGNVNHDTTVPLPDYVLHPRQGYDGENRDRIIVSASQQVINQVFITQHYQTWEQRGTLYDPNHTYQITTALLRQIREFSIRDNNLPLFHLRNRYQSNADIGDLQQTWGNLACLGLFLAIVIKETHTPRQGSNRLPNTPGHLPTNTPRHLPTNTPKNNNNPWPTNTPRHLPTNTPQNNNRPSSISSQSTRWEYTYSNDNNRRANCSCRFVCILVFSCIFILLGLVTALVIYFYFFK